MHRHPREIQDRIRKLLDLYIRPAVHPERAALEVAAHHVGGEPISYDDASTRAFEPFEIGGAWGGTWDTTWFRFTGKVPPEWRGREVVALIDVGRSDFELRERIVRAAPGFGAEGLVWAPGGPVQGVNVKHDEVVIAGSAEGGEPVDLLVEAAANPSPQLGSDPAPILLAEPDGPPLYRLQRAELAAVRRDVEAFFHDVRILFELSRELREDDPRGAEILQALEDMANRLDPADVPGTIEGAREVLAGVLSRPAVPSAHRISAVGHAHIDTAWLWPLRETVRKCARTFSTALALMDEYPEYVFACSQPQQYAWMKEHYPGIYERIKEKVRAGQWEPVGSMWVEPDCNIPSGESLVRQILYGKTFFEEEFGVDTEDVWLPDVFGYAANLPQIMKGAGIRYFLTQKLSWNRYNKLPHHTFLWEGIDGTRIFTHFPPSDTYNGSFEVRQLLHTVRNFKDHGRATRSLYPYGFGDGGGGPTRQMLESAGRMADLEGLPRVELEGVRDFFHKAEAETGDLPVWVGELYLELHRGTYTTQARTKLANRRAEQALAAAELWSAARSDGVYPVEELDEAWKLTLLHQFHDILPGSSINWVYRENERDMGRALALAHDAISDATQAIADEVDTDGLREPTIVFNPTGHARTELVEVRSSTGAVAGPGGEPLAVQPLAEGSVLAAVEVPSCGYTVVASDEQTARESRGVTVDEHGIANDRLRVRWDERGLLTSVYDLESGREVLAPGTVGNLFQLHHDYPSDWDAWDVDLHYLEQVEDLTDLESLEVVSTGPLRGEVRMTRRFGSSWIAQRIRLDRGSRVLTFDTEVDWHEDHRFLKVAFPVDVHTHRATYEIQFGVIERPTHANTSWDLARFEVCAQRWADLGEPGYGVALLNDCKYGHDIRGNVMRLSLLRAPTAPDPVADRGRHAFRYGLMPHPGDFREAGVVQAAAAFNEPLLAVGAESGAGSRPTSASLVAVDRPNVAVSAVKKALREDATVVRIYEAWGSRGPVRIACGFPAAGAVRVDLLEREIEPLEVTDGAVELTMGPFEVATILLRHG